MEKTRFDSRGIKSALKRIQFTENTFYRSIAEYILSCANCKKEYYMDKFVSEWICNKCRRLDDPSVVPSSKSKARIINLPVDVID